MYRTAPLGVHTLFRSPSPPIAVCLRTSALKKIDSKRSFDNAPVGVVEEIGPGLPTPDRWDGFETSICVQGFETLNMMVLVGVRDHHDCSRASSADVRDHHDFTSDVRDHQGSVGRSPTLDRRPGIRDVVFHQISSCTPGLTHSRDTSLQTRSESVFSQNHV